MSKNLDVVETKKPACSLKCLPGGISFESCEESWAFYRNHIARMLCQGGVSIRPFRSHRGSCEVETRPTAALTFWWKCEVRTIFWPLQQLTVYGGSVTLIRYSDWYDWYACMNKTSLWFVIPAHNKTYTKIKNETSLKWLF